MIARCEGTMEALAASSLATLEELYVILLKVLFFCLIFYKKQIKQKCLIFLTFICYEKTLNNK